MSAPIATTIPAAFLQRLDELEKRATIAEKKLAAAPAAPAVAPAAAPASAATEARLRELRALIVEDQREAQAAAAQRDELKAENGKLKTEVEQLHYRVKHLLRTVEALEAKK
jgi:FtsZ-binding cell division protein ZapB